MKLSSRSSNLSAREEKFESSADVILRREGGAEATTATIAVAAAIANTVREALVIILEKQTFAAMRFIKRVNLWIRKGKRDPNEISGHPKKDLLF